MWKHLCSSLLVNKAFCFVVNGTGCRIFIVLDLKQNIIQLQKQTLVKHYIMFQFRVVLH